MCDGHNQMKVVVTENLQRNSDLLSLHNSILRDQEPESSQDVAFRTWFSSCHTQSTGKRVFYDTESLRDHHVFGQNKE